MLCRIFSETYIHIYHFLYSNYQFEKEYYISIKMLSLFIKKKTFLFVNDSLCYGVARDMGLLSHVQFCSFMFFFFLDSLLKQRISGTPFHCIKFFPIKLTQTFNNKSCVSLLFYDANCAFIAIGAVRLSFLSTTPPNPSFFKSLKLSKVFSLNFLKRTVKCFHQFLVNT